MGRDRWATKLGLVLALAGNAIGLGNFLRFPVQAAQNGGGAFMIPYFLALLVIGVPLMWVECAIGRLGGARGYGHTAGMFQVLWRHPVSKYLGVLGLFIPFTVSLYYVYITSWTLAFSVFSLTGTYLGAETREAMGAFLKGYQGVEHNGFFDGIGTAYAFYILTLGLTALVLSGGIARGIERLARVAMPLLFLLGTALAVRVLLFGTPDPSYPERNVWDGLGFVWNPRLDQLSDASIWLAAAGQVFFTLSVGWGIVHTYVSYVPENEDVALTGLSTAGLNEFAEVVLGGTIAIPVAVAFFGLPETRAVAQGGAFDLGFQAMPLIFQRTAYGGLVGATWFLLLFFAGLTSAVAIMQPAITLVREAWGVSVHRAAALVAGAVWLCTQPVIFFLGYGFLDEIDFWVGSFALVLFALIESVVFAWVFGMEKGWREILRGAAVSPPRIFYYVIKYVTPAFLGLILLAWVLQEVPDKVLMRGVAGEAVPYLWAARLMMAAILVGFVLVIRAAWRSERE